MTMHGQGRAKSRLAAALAGPILGLCGWPALTQSPHVEKAAIISTLGGGQFCIEIPNDERRAGVRLRLARCSGDVSQQFTVGPNQMTWVSTTDEWNRSARPLAADLCLGTAAGTNSVELAPCYLSGALTAALQWCRECKRSGEGVHLVHSNALCLGIASEAATSASELIFSECRDSDQQRWGRKRIGRVYYVN